MYWISILGAKTESLSSGIVNATVDLYDNLTSGSGSTTSPDYLIF